MGALLLAVIYLTFISLGLPDALLGSAWPEMHKAIKVPVSYAGIITFIIACGTVFSSLCSNWLNQKFGTGKVTAFSVLLTALALGGFSLSGEFRMLCVLAVPYGLGAGAIDAALNNYVALHYSSRHMNWLHGFWGVGIAVSPYIMSYSLAHQLGWQMGYRTVSVIQIVLTAVVFLSLPLWIRTNKKEEEVPDAVPDAPATTKEALKIPGVMANLAAFFCYCAMEASAFLWACSFLVFCRNIEPATAARWSGLLFIGMVAGRFGGGLISNRAGDRNMIRWGLGLVTAGIAGLLIPWHGAALAGLFLLGLGYAPIYPAFIHETPTYFGRKNSQAIVGIQMASAYIGATLFPPVFGVLAQWLSFGIFPYFVIFFTVLTFLFSEKMNRIVDRNTTQQITGQTL